MTIGVYTIDLHLAAARSLKDKRQVFRRLKDRLRSRYNVAVAESAEHANLWQRGSLTVVSVAQDRDALERLFEAIYKDALGEVPAQVLHESSEFLDASEVADRPEGER